MNDPIRMTCPMYWQRKCRYFGKRIKLTPLQAEVLIALLLHRGAVVSHNELIEFVYPNADEEPDFAKDCIRQYISRLQLKMPGLIVNWPRRGWIIYRPQENELREAA